MDSKAFMANGNDVSERDIGKAAARAVELASKSTRVVGWYAHTYGDQRAGGLKTVRGPFCRWFALQEGADPDRNGKSQGCLAPAESDIEFAAFALNNISSIATAYLAQRDEAEKLLQDMLRNKDVIWRNRYDDALTQERQRYETLEHRFNALLKQASLAVQVADPAPILVVHGEYSVPK